MNQKGFVNIALVILVIILASTGVYFVLDRQTTPPIPIPTPAPSPIPTPTPLPSQKPKPAVGINTFEECAKAGYPVGESYPRQCWTPDRRHFVEKLTIEQAKELLSPWLLTQTGVVGVGIGECEGDPCIRVMLEKELENLPNLKNKIPSESNGFKVVIEVTGLICTQEAKACPDGSIVGRNQTLKCEFDPCPGEKQVSVSLREGQRESSFLLEKIYPEHITGLHFPEYPIAFERGLPITLRIGESVSNGCTVTLTLIGIENNVATFIKKTDPNKPCPRCLAENTLIDTPSGAIAVQNLQKGAVVWTLNSSGARVPAKILETARTPVPLTHRIIHLVLDDGRELFVSPGHPTGDGRIIGNLSVGDTLDGSRVTIAENIPYQKDFTYDILPSGETGFYWANGILIGSTLSHTKNKIFNHDE